MGIASIQPGATLPFENKMVLIDPSGQIVVNYLKSRPVAGWEASIMVRGDAHVPIVSTSVGRIATAICFEADFPEFIRQAGKGRADLLMSRRTSGRRSRTCTFRWQRAARSRTAFLSSGPPPRESRAQLIRGDVSWRSRTISRPAIGR